MKFLRVGVTVLASLRISGCGISGMQLTQGHAGNKRWRQSRNPACRPQSPASASCTGPAAAVPLQLGWAEGGSGRTSPTVPSAPSTFPPQARLLPRQVPLPRHGRVMVKARTLEPTDLPLTRASTINFPHDPLPVPQLRFCICKMGR